MADQVEIQRLVGISVLSRCQDAKTLSPRFVRTWREKKNSDGAAIWLRRSSLVAREYVWLDPNRDALYSPATPSIASKELPTMFLMLKESSDAIMVSVDVKDAFLTVNQRVSTRVHLTDAGGMTRSFSLGKVLPSHRDGSLLWYEDLASEKTIMDQWTPRFQSKYNVSLEIVSKPGDEVAFLKRIHALVDDGRLIIKNHHNLLSQLCKLLRMNPKIQNKKSPGRADIENPDNASELSSAESSTLRLDFAYGLFCRTGNLMHGAVYETWRLQTRELGFSNSTSGVAYGSQLKRKANSTDAHVLSHRSFHLLLAEDLPERSTSCISEGRMKVVKETWIAVEGDGMAKVGSFEATVDVTMTAAQEVHQLRHQRFSEIQNAQASSLKAHIAEVKEALAEAERELEMLQNPAKVARTDAVVTPSKSKKGDDPETMLTPPCKPMQAKAACHPMMRPAMKKPVEMPMAMPDDQPRKLF
eukprot:s2776_g9.t1